jgi:uncharacterized protein (TIGR02452 family)
MSVSRSRAAEIAAAALTIMRTGHYTNLLDERIELRDALDAARHGTIEYPPDADLPRATSSLRETVFEVNEATTLAAAERLARAGANVCALNFASAKHPGGGFQNGARAQEESLCRSSGLYTCIQSCDMYRHHARQGGGFYTNYAIYSPNVPVFFTDNGNPLASPYACSFITAPAVNAGTYLRDHPKQGATRIRREMADRIAKVLAIAAGHAHDALVLGAWGCGVFRNDPEMIAELFADALRGPFMQQFTRVVFAIYSSGDEAMIEPFRTRFA